MIPKLRFQDFTDDWEQRKFSDCYRVSSGYAFKMSDYCDDGIGLINGESIQHGIINGDNLNYLPEAFIQQYPDFVLKEGDIVIGLNRPITNGNLKIARIPSKYNGSLLYQRAGKIVYKVDCDKEFSYVLLSQEILKHTLVEAVGSDQPFISTSKLNKWQMMLPSNIEEQKKVGNYFRNLDNLITLHQRKYEQLKITKNNMCKKIFSQEIRFNISANESYTDWVEKDFASVFTILKNNTLSREELNYEDGIVQNIHYGDILIKFGSVVNAEKENLPYITDDEKAQKHLANVLENGDIVIADTAEDETVGKVVEITDCNHPVVAGLHTIPCRPAPGLFYNGFLGYYLNSHDYHNQLRPLMQGIKVTSISKSAIQKTTIKIPCIEEQKKITEFLVSYDKLIENEKRQIDIWQSIKKGFLQQMFC